jgi:hypothetical protein
MNEKLTVGFLAALLIAGLGFCGMTVHGQEKMSVFDDDTTSLLYRKIISRVDTIIPALTEVIDEMLASDDPTVREWGKKFYATLMISAGLVAEGTPVEDVPTKLPPLSSEFDELVKKVESMASNGADIVAQLRAAQGALEKKPETSAAEAVGP